VTTTCTKQRRDAWRRGLSGQGIADSCGCVFAVDRSSVVDASNTPRLTEYDDANAQAWAHAPSASINTSLFPGSFTEPLSIAVRTAATSSSVRYGSTSSAL
jgi:hypothetical protein